MASTATGGKNERTRSTMPLQELKPSPMRIWCCDGPQGAKGKIGSRRRVEQLLITNYLYKVRCWTARNTLWIFAPGYIGWPECQLGLASKAIFPVSGPDIAQPMTKFSVGR